jgi:hypothetical protein
MFKYPHFIKSQHNFKYVKEVLIAFTFLIFSDVFPQGTNPYQKGLSAEQNLNAITNLSANTSGGMGFDSRYEGVKGSPRLFDTLYPSLLKVKGQDYYIKLESDIDVFHNRLIFIHPKTKKLLSIPSEIVTEVVISPGGNDQLYRTSAGMKFDKEIKGQKFCQILRDGEYQFIKMAEKTFNEADYKGLYSVDRRFDEYETKYRYYLMGKDSVLHQIQLTRKALTKLYPDKKNKIDMVFNSDSFKNDEDRVLSVLNQF